MKKLNVKRILNLRSFALVGIFVIALFAVSCNKADDMPEPMYQDMELKKGKPEVKPGAPAKGNMTIAEIVVASNEADEPEFTLLFAALEYAGLTSVFAGGDQYTVFAPTDAAFINLVTAVTPLLDAGILADEGPFAAIDSLLGPGTIANVLLYHVTDGRRATNSVVPKNNPRVIETLLEGATFSVDSDPKITAVGNMANFVENEEGNLLINISASNGIIHVIDTVILPVVL
jgi:transforming growth factor-beta-induced protein